MLDLQLDLVEKPEPRTKSNLTAQDIHFTALQWLSEGRTDDAKKATEAALVLDPSYHPGWHNRGSMLFEEGVKTNDSSKFFEAVLSYNHAIQIERKPEYLANRGMAWQNMGIIGAARGDYDEALKARHWQEPLFNYGNLEMLECNWAKALDYYTEAIQLGAGPHAWLYRAMCRLHLGDLKQGFLEFESRWQTGFLPIRRFSFPTWQGEDLNGKSIYLYGEQGLGDIIQFVRYATTIKERWDCKVVVEVRGTLLHLADSVPGVDHVAVYGEQPPVCDYNSSMISAGIWLGIELDTIPAPSRYMWPSRYRVDQWRSRLQGEFIDACDSQMRSHYLVGLCWAGQARPQFPHANQIDQRRSTQLAHYAPLFELPGVTFISLQMGEPAKQVKHPPAGPAGIWNNDLDFEDFADTAALMECCDLVVSVDTAVAHVAAAIGRPTLLLSRFDACWRWLYGVDPNRVDSPWYPSMRLFRQPHKGAWGPVMVDVAKYLGSILESKRNRGVTPALWGKGESGEQPGF